MDVTRAAVIRITILLEGVLALAFFVWNYYEGRRLQLIPTFYDISAGIVAVIPLLIINYLLFGTHARKIKLLEPFLHFKEHVVRPLVSILDLKSGLILSCAAGIGEELFFRGIIQAEFGIAVASLSFGICHFPLSMRRDRIIVIVYILIGFYFGFLQHFCQTLWVPVIAHSLYDFIALSYMRYFEPIPAAFPTNNVMKSIRGSH